MSPQPEQDLVQTLERTRREFTASVEGVSEKQANFRPAPERWTILENVEHVATVEERFLDRIANAARLEAPRREPQREAELLATLSSPTRKVVAPEAALPTGRFATLADAMAHFHSMRDRAVRAAQERGDDLAWLDVEHPRFGHLNGAELLTIICAHGLRHAQQIREIRAAQNSVA